METVRSNAPEGFQYRADFVSPEEERDLLRAIEGLSFNEVRMHGVIAKRRVAHFGWVYGYESWRLTPGQPIPEFLNPLLDRVADLLEAPAEQIAEVLVTQYPPGSGIGWHRDAPLFGPRVVGVSLLGPCRLRFQRREQDTRWTSSVPLNPRSAYVLAGEARRRWQHAITATPAWRYSVTFRTLGGMVRTSEAVRVRRGYAEIRRGSRDSTRRKWPPAPSD